MGLQLVMGKSDVKLALRTWRRRPSSVEYQEQMQALVDLVDDDEYGDSIRGLMSFYYFPNTILVKEILIWADCTCM